MRRYALRDDQWDRIKDLLPGRLESVGVTAKNNRLFVEAVLYRYKAGVPWRDLPEQDTCKVSPDDKIGPTVPKSPQGPTSAKEGTASTSGTLQVSCRLPPILFAERSPNQLGKRKPKHEKDD